MKCFPNLYVINEIMFVNSSFVRGSHRNCPSNFDELWYRDRYGPKYGYGEDGSEGAI